MSLGKRIAPTRFLVFVVSSAVSCALAGYRLGWRDGSLIGFDIGAVLFLGSLWPLLRNSGAQEMRRHAAGNTANRALMLLMTSAVMLAVLTAVALELSPKGNPSPAGIALIITTLVLAWLFTNSVFALHYAHMCYLEADGLSDCGGIEFPGTPEPDYRDFIYFAFCLGMTFQTSDMNITATRVRKVATVHCMLAFVFSIGAIAFTINVLGGGGGSASVPAAAH